MKTLSALALTVSFLFITGCSRPPAKEADLAKIRDLKNSFAQISAFNASSEREAGVQSISDDIFDIASDQNQEISQKLSRAVQNAGRDCIKTPVQTSEGSLKKTSFSISGPRCPVRVTLNTEISRSGTEPGQMGESGQFNISNSTKIDVVFEILSAELASEVDVRVLTMSANINSNFSNASMSASANFWGTMESKKHGKVDFNLNASGSNSSVNLSIVVTGKDLDIELRAEQNQSEAKYFINGEVVDEAKFKENILFIPKGT